MSPEEQREDLMKKVKRDQSEIEQMTQQVCGGGGRGQAR